MRILIITNQIPYPLVSGAPLRTYNILRRLAADCEVYLAAFTATEEQRAGVVKLREICQEVLTVNQERIKEALQFGKVLKSLSEGEPPEVRLAFSEEMAREIRKLADRVDFDIIQIEHGSMGMYLDALPSRKRERAVWILHDIDFDKFARMASVERRADRKLRAWMHAKAMRLWQPRFASLFRYCVTMSEADRRLLLSANSGLRVEVSPNGVDASQYQLLPDDGGTADMLFIGNMGYQPNVDAVVYFCREVLPLIRENVREAKLWIVGINPAEAVRRLDGDCVVVTGAVPDVVPYYRRASVCVVPLRAGSGTRLKIMEAMALGRPVVSTSKGCEGLDVVDGEHIRIADDSASFAKRTTELLEDNQLRARLAMKAREFVATSYDWDVISKRLVGDYVDLIKQDRDCSGQKA